MVALKRKQREKKDEKRHLKQERRGGIETSALVGILDIGFNEAGTPWWH